VQIAHNFGRADDPAVTERLRRLAHSILRRCVPEEIIAQDPSWRLIDAWPYGEIYVLEALWRRLGIAEAITEVVGHRKFGFSVERALFAMVANRVCAPASKLYCYEQWLAEEVHIEGTEGLGLQHLYRAMDFLEANQEVLEEAIYFRTADRLNLDVELVFYDTPSLHFEIDGEDGGTAMARCAGVWLPDPSAMQRRASGDTRRTGVAMHPRSSSDWRSPGTVSRFATGSFPAIRWT